MLRLTNAEEDEIFPKVRDRKKGNAQRISPIKTHLTEGD